MTAEVFCELLIKSRLLAPEAARQHLLRWQSDAKNKASAPDFAGWLVAQQHLTTYQAGLLLNERTDGFFIDQYRILDRIGKGRMAGVYHAVHNLGQMVALKVLPPSQAKDPEMLARFQREARLAMQLNHPNTMRTFHFGEDHGLHYLTMEYVNGATLAELLQERGKLPPKEVVRIGFLTALGLQHLHEKGLVHGDLRPANLMLTPAPGLGENTLRSMVKILGIGLGGAFDAERKGAETMIGEGELLSTSDYLAPEQARDARRADVRSDVYSLGCTLYHALTGQPPFPDTNPVRQMLKHAMEAPLPLKEFSPDAPDDLQRILDKLLAKEPAQRFQTPKEAADALRSFLASEGETARSKPATAEEQSYEEWVHKTVASKAERSSAPAEAATGTAAPPRAAKQPAVAPASAAAESQDKKRRRQKPQAAAEHADNAPVARSALIEIDVEPVPPSELKTPAPFGLGMPRDVFMILLGAMSVLGLVSVIWLIAVLLGGGGAPAE